MNNLKSHKQEMVISALVEGSSIRSVERMTGVHRDTIMRLMVRVGNACEKYMDRVMRNLKCEKVQVDEIWCYVGKKQNHLTNMDNPNKCGDFWTWIALDADSKLIPSHRVGKRDSREAKLFIQDLSSRLENRIQLSSDMLKFYVTAVEESFGADVDYGQIVKSYEADYIGPGRYSPPQVVSAERSVLMGNPDPKHISTSYIERQNLTMRMSMRRFTRLTNAFSKKVENLKAAVSLHFCHYNFVRIHKTIKCTPAMEAKVDNRLWTVGDLIELAN